MPSEPEEDSKQSRFLMDLDLDLDGPWPLDQIVGSPFFISSSEHHHQQQQPFSPLWAFSDDVNNGGGLRMLSYAHNPDVVKDDAFHHDDKRQLPSPFVGLMPIDNIDGTCVIKERMAQALRYFKDSTEQRVLAQVWAPVKHGDRFMLTTSGQPFVLDPNSNGLHQYRMVSQIYMFSVDGDADGDLGLPGRVFRQKLPEWSPNVQYYSSKEFSRLNHALDYNVRGTLALPVFEPLGLTCVGVLELIMTSPIINYAPEVDKVCKALEAVNLKSSEILDHRSTQICNQGRQNALAEILEIITVVSETHTVPLAQTWVPCMHGSILANGGSFKKNCSSFDGSCKGQVCMSTTEVAFYVVDAHMWGFRDACAEHHLQKGQGVAGRAFASKNSCFCPDVTEFCKIQYPLVHYARMFGLRSSFAICLRSNFTGDDDYVLEFFLPNNVESYREQRALLDSILVTMKQHFGSLRVASGKDLDEEWRSIEIVKASLDEKADSKPNYVVSSPTRNVALPIGEPIRLDTSEGQKIKAELNVNSVKENTCNGNEINNARSAAEMKDPGKKKSERKRGKAEKTISLEVLQQYFAGSLKDAAKSLGVCPTTMKRICRQHGISRWPSRKINKVNRSLSKLKRVIESVQGGEGSFSLTSLDANPIPGTVGSLSWAANLSGANPQTLSGQKPLDFQDDKKDFDVTTFHEQNEDSQCLNNAILKGKGTNQSRSRSGSREESIEAPASQGSCQGTSGTRNKTSPQNDRIVSPVGDHETQIGEINLAAAFSIPGDFMVTAHDEGFGGMLLEDAGSSHDLRNLCPPIETVLDENITAKIDPCDQKQFTEKSHSKIVTIKAAYREDIIRFRLAMDAGIVSLREEVSKRLKLELGTFDIKYLDDDHEWVLIACDADLLECIDLSRSSGGNIVRLLVHDINANLGSSCESSGQ